MHGGKKDERSAEAPGRPNPGGRGWIRSTRLLLMAIGLVGVTLSVLACWGLIKVQFHIDAEQRAGAIQRNFDAHLKVASALTAFYGASREVERGEFHSFTKPLLASHAGIEQLAWAPRVLRQEQGDHQRKIQEEEGIEDYQIHELDDRGHPVAAGQRKEFFPVCYLEPGDHRLLKLGFDVASHPACREAIQAARNSGQLEDAGYVGLGRDGGEADGYFVVIPIFHKEKPIDTPQQRQENLQGVVLGVCQIGTIVDEVLGRYEDVGMDVRLFDDPLSSEGKLLHSYLSPGGGEPAASVETGPPEFPRTKMLPGIDYSTVLEVPNPQWSFSCTPTAADSRD